ncbi:Adaptor complexes medium subunit family-domain-containing protein [Elsinoe ampelina]|uniref:Adaptor complexes medium subunit family-domain-containing protein n=1 Tax=Elsinoe ampelina TaxID=302913 RepID=A0A6A6GEZ3_9PEZI|nr:Adaptor complexes medium subunit family-domain-containing protein [Elsinoe ampelina]
MSGIEAVYIFDEHNNLLLSHPFSLRPPPPLPLLNLYLTHAPSPPSLLFAHKSDSLLLLSPTTTDVPPLLVLEFLHRTTDSLREFLGSPLLPSRLEANYDLAAQILAELCDAGLVASTEPNALRDAVEVPSSLTRLLGGATPSLAPGGGGQGMGTAARMQGIGSGDRPGSRAQGQESAIPWRRSGVRHTSNELYVDLVEEVRAVFAPSGRALEAVVHGAVAFNCKVSGVPDLLLVLRTDAGGGDRGERVRRVMQRPVFHPCVRLARWKGQGELSFVPPDGRFVLAGYETDLLEGEEEVFGGGKVDLPADLEVMTGLGERGNEFEVRLVMNSRWRGTSGRASPVSAGSSQQSLSNALGRGGPRGLGAAGSLASLSTGSESKGPQLEDLKVVVPLPAAARKLPEIRASRGEAHFSPAESGVTWVIPGKVASQISSAVLRCTVVGQEDDSFGEAEGMLGSNGIKSTTYDYDEDDAGGYQDDGPAPAVKQLNEKIDSERRKAAGDALMPRSVNLSFSVKGWLASGLRVDSLTIDTKRSRGLGEGVKPYKGVKYLTASRGGVEVRC